MPAASRRPTSSSTNTPPRRTDSERSSMVGSAMIVDLQGIEALPGSLCGAMVPGQPRELDQRPGDQHQHAADQRDRGGTQQHPQQDPAEPRLAKPAAGLGGGARAGRDNRGPSNRNAGVEQPPER